MTAEYSQYGPSTDSLPANIADGILKRNAANTAWEQKTASQLNSLVQTVFADQAGDTTVTSAQGWQDLLTANITTEANFILVQATASLSNTNSGRNIFIRLTVDGVVKRGAMITNDGTNSAESAGIVWRQAVTSAAHVVKLQWSTSANTAQCRPVAVPSQEHASMLVQEVRN